MLRFRWGRPDDPRRVAQSIPPEADEGPTALTEALDQINRFINQKAGRLPGVAVVNARRLTDTLRQIIDTSAVRPLDVHAMLCVKATLGDYLPTTLRNYLSLTEGVTAGPGEAPMQLILEQIATFQTVASEILVAVRRQDVDALITHGNFLRIKYSGSDLDL